MSYSCYEDGNTISHTYDYTIVSGTVNDSGNNEKNNLDFSSVPNLKKTTVKIDVDSVSSFTIKTHSTTNIWITFLDSTCNILSNKIFMKKNTLNVIHKVTLSDDGNYPPNTVLEFTENDESTLKNVPITLNKNMNGAVTFGKNTNAQIKYEEDVDVFTIDRSLYPMTGKELNIGCADFKFKNICAESFTSFTGSHICNVENRIAKILENRKGYIAVSAGGPLTIKLDSALPQLALSTKAEDKCAFGVISEVELSKNRVRVNSIGEGAIMVSNINGNIENGDYITSSSILGIGGKQNDDLLHNYTVAKATMDCNFDEDCTYITEHGQILDESEPDCYKMKLISCTYHCG